MVIVEAVILPNDQYYYDRAPRIHVGLQLSSDNNIISNSMKTPGYIEDG